MFYSHEILTSREGGVATVWLVATLGSKSNLKRVNRKAILDVNVPKTCEIIITPQAPMALRLQSNLLYGVARVYSQQCGYILSDAQTAQSNMRALLEAVRTAELDPNAGKARPEQLILHDDPAFLPEYFLPDLPAGFSAFDLSTDDYVRSSVLSPYSRLSINKGDDDSTLGLVIPSSGSGGGGEIGGFVFPTDNASSIRHSAEFGGVLGAEKEDFDPDPGFTIDEEGNLVLTKDQRTPQRHLHIEAQVRRIGSDSATSAHVRREHQEGLEAGQIKFGEAMDLDLNQNPMLGNAEVLMPEAEAFPAIKPKLPLAVGLLRSSSKVPHEESSEESADALLRPKRRLRKALPFDTAPELRHTDLARWNDCYLANMANETRGKLQHGAARLAKKNAAFWVGGSGIGGIGSFLASSTLRTPLDIFAGNALMEALTNAATSALGRKRDRDEEDDHAYDKEERRVRMRDEDGNQPGNINDLPMDGNENLANLAGEGIEVGRDAQAALEDQSLPWNVSASVALSRTGSVAPGLGFPSSAGGYSGSAGRPGSLIAGFGGRPSSLDRRASRIASASPLQVRGLERYSSLELPARDDDEDELLGGHDFSDSQGLNDFQLYGPAAGVSTQTAAESQWIRATLDHEGNNFLEFLKFEIAGKMARIGKDERSVFFEELLPPAQHTNIVAAQALHHVLALATKGLINVQQDVDYGPIALTLTAGV